MSILIGKYEFEGPYGSIAELEEKAGLFAILHLRNQEYELIHLAEAENVKERFALSPTTDHFDSGEIVIIAMYTPSASGRARKSMMSEVQSEFDDDFEDAEIGSPRIELAEPELYPVPTGHSIQ